MGSGTEPKVDPEREAEGGEMMMTGGRRGGTSGTQMGEEGW